MDYLISFGIIVCFVVTNVAGKEFVTVGRSMEVKATPNPLKDVRLRVDAELNCTGSRSELSYYIKNRVAWTFIDSNGYELPLTEGFYTTKQAQDLFFGQDARYLLTYRRDVGGYRFDIKITGVTHADNGIFRCSLLNENSQVIDEKDVKITVVKPVQEVSLEIHDSKHNVLAQSNSPLGNQSTPLELSPGEYMIQCDSYGSNPAPSMSILFNENLIDSTVVATKVIQDNMVSYNASISIMSHTIMPHSAVQTIACSSNIPGEFYPTMHAGISLMVKNSKPEVTCSNVTTMIGNKYQTVECGITTDSMSMASLNCSHVSWLLGDENVYIDHDQRWTDPNGKFDILEGACENSDDGLAVTLTIYTVKSAHFKELFYVVYEGDTSVYRYAVQDFNEGEYSKAASFVPSLAIIISVSITLIRKLMF